MTRADLLIPWAMDDAGRVVDAAQAERGGSYRCPNPSCSTQLVLRAGQLRVRHFAHPRGSHCTGETALHWAAKQKVAEVVTRWAKGEGSSPHVRRVCEACGRQNQESLPGAATGARLEANVWGARPDVLLVDATDSPVMAVEVLVSSPVDGQKAVLFEVPWIEVQAEAILQSPLEWVPIQRGNLSTYPCDHFPPPIAADHGQYRVTVLGTQVKFTESYPSLGFARDTLVGYLGSYHWGRAVDVLVEGTEGRYLGTFDKGGWTKRLCPLVERRPRKPW